MVRRRRLRRAEAIWSERFLCRLCRGDWKLIGVLRSGLHKCATRLMAAEVFFALPGLKPAAPPGTANNSAGSRVHMIRPKCRRLMLQILGLMLHEIDVLVIGGS